MRTGEFYSELQEAKGLENREVLVNMNTDVLDKVSDLVGMGAISIKGYLTLAVHNERARDEKDYTVLVIVDEDGHGYYTSSPAFTSSLQQIFDASEKLGIADGVRIEVVEKQSRTNAGKMLLAKAAL